MTSIEGRSETVVVAAEDAGERLDRVLAARMPDAVALAPQGADPRRRTSRSARAHDPRSGPPRQRRRHRRASTLPPPEAGRARSPRTSRSHRLRGRRPHRHRQAGGPGRASRRRPRDRHAGQCADRPLRRQPLRHRRRAAARHRAPPRQGHHRPDGGGQDRPRPSARSPRSSPTTAAPGRCSAAISPSSGARRTAPSGTIDAPLDRHPADRDKHGGARRRPRGHHPLGGARALRRRADGKPVASLLACLLETGRTHQIRVHLAHIGHPLLGDADLRHRLQDQGQLGCRAAAPRSALEALGRQALHAYLAGLRASGRRARIWSSDRNCRPILRRLRHSAGAPPGDTRFTAKAAANQWLRCVHGGVTAT